MEKFIAHDDRALAAWVEVRREKEGGNRNPVGTNQYSKTAALASDATTGEIPGQVTTDIISSDLTRISRRSRQDGTSRDQGMRRLQDAAAAGDDNAVELLRRVLNPDDKMSIHGVSGFHQPLDCILGVLDIPVPIFGQNLPVGDNPRFQAALLLAR